MKAQLTALFSFILGLATLTSGAQALFSDSEKVENSLASDESDETSIFSESEHTSFLEKKEMSGNKDRFSAINLKELKRTVLNQMMKDDLIDSKKSKVYLFLREEGFTLNNQKFSSALNEKYTKLLAPFDIGTGPNRTILLTEDCTAVGDFTEGNFRGKMEGRLRIEYTQKPFEF